MISNLDIDDSIKTACLKAQVFEVNTLYTYTKDELIKLLDLIDTDIVHLLKAAAQVLLSNRCASVYDIVKNNAVATRLQHYKLSLRCKEIDKILGGGFLYPGVNEICGESASGKTQLCMQLCLTSKFPNGQSSGGSLYICTEDVFPTKRLRQMSSRFYARNKAVLNLKDLKDVTDDIFIEHIADLDDLWTLVDIRIESLLSKCAIKLIVIDSVAALFRAEFDAQDMANRARTLSKLGQRLHSISFQYKICVICVNQVSDIFDSTASNVNMDGTRNVAPALGLTWSYVVNTRIMLSRTKWTLCTNTSNNNHNPQEQNETDTTMSSNIRKLKILFSPHLALAECYFVVDEDGIKDFIPEK